MKLKNNNSDPVPEWFIDELAKTPDPDESTLCKYDYMKDDFFGAVDRAAGYRKRQSAKKPAAIIEVVFSIAGKVIKNVENIIVETIPPPAFAQVATRGTRGSEKAEKPSSGRKVISRVRKTINDVFLEITVLEESGTTKFEVNLVDSESGTEKRPIKVSVYDQVGKELVPPVDVLSGEMPPKFPDPSPGDYLFTVAWTGGVGSLLMSVQSND